MLPGGPVHFHTGLLRSGSQGSAYCGGVDRRILLTISGHNYLPPREEPLDYIIPVTDQDPYDSEIQICQAEMHSDFVILPRLSISASSSGCLTIGVPADEIYSPGSVHDSNIEAAVALLHARIGLD